MNCYKCKEEVNEIQYTWWALPLINLCNPCHDEWLEEREATFGSRTNETKGSKITGTKQKEDAEKESEST